MKQTAPVPVNPKLPRNFSDTRNEDRPPSHQKWWDRPYIETYTYDQIHGDNDEHRAAWFEAWPSGTRYDVRCLDGGAWDRPTCWGMFKTLQEAIDRAGGAMPPGSIPDLKQLLNA